MAKRSQIKRLLQPSLFALLCAALLPPLVTGCQSNAQQDLIAREMRMQEDQIYAMEDYLAQYQQLICKYRAENAALQRQLANGDPDAPSPTPRQAPRIKNGTAPTTDGPAIEVPPTRRPNGTRPQPELEVPEVPPLEETTSSDIELEFQSAAADGVAALAAPGMNSSPVTPAIAFEPMTPTQTLHDVWLHGEVIESDAGGGPRLVIEVEPLDATGNATQYAGALSLMLLAPGDKGGQQSLARWDFAPHEVQLAAEAADGKHTIRFHLELPSDTPVTDSTELWVRLLPQSGIKLLTHTPIDVHEPGPFSSIPEAAAPRNRSEDQPVAAAIFGKSPSSPPIIESEIQDGGWTIARPGEPAASANARAASISEWRAASEPPPVIVARTAPARPKPHRSQTALHSETPKTTAADDRMPIGWSPDRPTNASANTPRTATKPARPRWSATR